MSRVTKAEGRGAAVRAVLADVLKRIDPEQRLQAFEVWRYWQEEVGATLARRSRPSAFRNGVLVVDVSSHAWIQDLQFIKESVRQRLNTRIGRELIRDIYFASGAVALPEPDGKAQPPDPPPDASDIALPTLSDPALASVFQRIVHAHRRRRR
jgi:hypothetical protein